MIRFRSQTILVHNHATGQTRPLDTDALQERLDGAFARCGTQEQGITENLFPLLLKHFEQAEGLPAHIGQEELLELVAQVLRDLGHPKAAQAFLQAPASQPTPPTPAEAPRQSYDALPNLLRTTRHIAANDWKLPLSPEQELLVQKRVLAFRPLTDIQPMLALECRPSRLYDLPSCPRTELELHLLLPQLAFQISAVLGLMRNEVQKRWKIPPESSARIIFLEINALVQVSCPSRSARARQLFAEQLREELTASLQENSPCQLLMEFLD